MSVDIFTSLAENGALMKNQFRNIKWTNTLFLSGTLLTALVATPIYIAKVGLSLPQFVLFIFFLVATGLSITLGYHRLFSHLTFKAKWPVKAFVLLFGAAAFEGSAIAWSADHRRHHKFVDHDDDPYDISKGLFYAHIGWLLFRTGPDTPLTWVRDLQKDRLAYLQHKYYIPIAVFMAFALPTLIGWIMGGATAALGAFLMAGVTRIVVVHHMTFCINSLCHWIGERPYSTNCTARDSFLMAICTFGEGYHNFHHKFQSDYRNGIRGWHFDPTKWTIWLLAKVGLAADLRRVPEEKILQAKIAEKEKQLLKKVAPAELPESMRQSIATAKAQVESAISRWSIAIAAYREAKSRRSEISRDELHSIKDAAKDARQQFIRFRQEWLAVYRHAILAA